MAKLSKMLEKFGNVTVMNVEFYEKGASTYNKAGITQKTKLATIDSLKISNITQEGPRKTATGGQNADVLIKYGKTMRVEMQDALGNYGVMKNLFGITEVSDDKIVVTDRFAPEMTMVGETFFIDQETGIKQPVVIVIPRFLPDSIFSLGGDAEGDVGVFDINGDILAFEEADIVPGADKYISGGDKAYYIIYTRTGYGYSS